MKSVKIEELAYVDTGYDGGVVLPTEHLPQLGSPDVYTVIELGDGRQVTVPEYYGEVEIGNLHIPASIVSIGGQYLLGREIIDKLRVCFHKGERIEIEF